MLLDAKGLHLRLDKETEVLEVGHLEWKRSESTKLEFHRFHTFQWRVDDQLIVVTSCVPLLYSQTKSTFLFFSWSMVIVIRTIQRKSSNMKI